MLILKLTCERYGRIHLYERGERLRLGGLGRAQRAGRSEQHPAAGQFPHPLHEPVTRNAGRMIEPPGITSARSASEMIRLRTRCG